VTRCSQRILVWFAREHWLIGAAAVRVLLGAWAIYYYLLHFPIRHTLWGPHGVWPHDRFLESQPFLSVWQISASPVFFEGMYVVGIAVAVAFTLGWHARLTGFLHWMMIWSLQERNQFITDGGDNIMRIILLFLVLVNTGAHFSASSHRRPRPLPEGLRQVRAIAHNVGILLILGQLSMLYMSTGLYKAMGELWQNGTALYYILRVDEFSWPGAAEMIYRNPYLVVAGTYGTVLFEVMFFPALFSRWTRYAAIAAGVAFHVAIGLVMGLVTFAWSMLSLYPLLLTDGQYRRAAAWVEHRFALAVLYDGWCPDCRRSVAALQAADVAALVRFVSFREQGIPELFDLDPQRLQRRIHSVRPDGTIREGMDAMVQIAGRAVMFWPLLPVLALARLVAGQRAYDLLAARRTVLVPASCDEACVVSDDRPGSMRP
jgi:predicted DCC family thiol-disulfide oxidoreductase YuxK